MKPTHTIEVSLSATNALGPDQECALRVAGDGDIEHWVDTFRAALVMAGFHPDIAKSLRLGDQEPS